MNISNREKNIIKYAKACEHLPLDLVPNSELIQLILMLSTQIENIDAACQDCKYFEYRYPETGTGFSRGACRALSNSGEVSYINPIYVKTDPNKASIDEFEIIVASNFICGLFSRRDEK